MLAEKLDCLKARYVRGESDQFPSSTLCISPPGRKALWDLFRKHALFTSFHLAKIDVYCHISTLGATHMSASSLYGQRYDLRYPISDHINNSGTSREIAREVMNIQARPVGSQLLFTLTGLSRLPVKALCQYDSSEYFAKTYRIEVLCWERKPHVDGNKPSIEGHYTFGKR